MKNISLIIILLSTVVCLSVFGQDAEIDVTAELDRIEDIPGVYYEYGSTGGNLRNEVLQLVETFNAYTNTELAAGEFDSERPLISNGKETFEMYNTLSKAFMWSKDINEYVNESNTEKLPGESVAEEFAKDHLKKLNLFPKKKNELALEHVGSSVLSIYNQETDSAEDYEKLRNVYFVRKLNGCKVIGGMRIIVQMGTDGELVKIINNWPELKEKKIGTISKKQKGHLIEKSKGYLNKHYKGTTVKSVKVDNATLVMYDDGNGIVEPALLLKGKLTNADGAVDKGDWIIPVLDDPKATYTLLAAKETPANVREDVRSLEEDNTEVQDEELSL